jgi:uncharacterized protein (DUF362 family)/ferredoxin
MADSRRSFIRKSSLFFMTILFIMSIPVKGGKRMIARTAAARKPATDNKPKKKTVFRQNVAVEPCDSYDPETVYRAMLKALDAIGFTARPGTKVLLKPNVIGQNTPEQAATTHPSVVDAACRYFREHGCSVSIGDSSAFYQGGGTTAGMETTGIAAVAKKHGARLIPFETTALREITGGKYLDPLYISEAVYEHDLVVNLPKLKVHRLARYTGAIKNVYGCISGGTKWLYHIRYQHRPDYQEMWGNPLVDVYEAVSPRLTIMDAVIGLDKDGPQATGEPRFTGLLLASTSGPALDVVACRIIGFEPHWVPAVREALARGLTDEEKITILGTLPLIPYVKLPDMRTSTGLFQKIGDYFFGQIMVTPVIELDKCTKCGACVEKCAPAAITWNNKRLPVIDYGKCVSCYCCEKYCAYDAIHLSGGTVNHIIRGVRYLFKI